jgi:hypothetical protein
MTRIPFGPLAVFVLAASPLLSAAEPAKTADVSKLAGVWLADAADLTE